MCGSLVSGIVFEPVSKDAGCDHAAILTYLSNDRQNMLSIEGMQAH
jgi:hypothetical protein